MDNQGELHKYFVLVFEKSWNVNLYKCVIEEQLWALFKLRNAYFVLSKLHINCYKKVIFVFVLVFEYIVKVKVLVAHRRYIFSGIRA